MNLTDPQINKLFREMDERRRREWRQTPAGQLFHAMKGGIHMHARWAVQRAYGRCEIGGSIQVLEDLVTGQRWVPDFGDASRKELAGLLFKWYKQRLGEE